jgi:hypothetical protein
MLSLARDGANPCAKILVPRAPAKSTCQEHHGLRAPFSVLGDLAFVGRRLSL